MQYLVQLYLIIYVKSVQHPSYRPLATNVLNNNETVGKHLAVTFEVCEF